MTAPVFQFWDDTVLCGIAKEQPFFHCPVQGVVEHHVDTPNGTAAQARLLAFLAFPQSAIPLQVFIQLLNLPAGELVQLDLPNPGDGVQLDTPPIVFRRSGADIGLGVEFIPEAKPFRYGVFIRADGIDLPAFFNRSCQFSFYFRLGLA